jgi:hypothetical protein
MELAKKQQFHVKTVFRLSFGFGFFVCGINNAQFNLNSALYL